MPHLFKFNRANRRSSVVNRDLFLVVGIALNTILGIVSVNPILPTIAKTFSVPPGQIGWVISAYVFPIVLGVPILGIFADRIGRKMTIVPSLILFAIAGVLCSTAPNFQTLLVWRFLQGSGAASLELMALTLIGDLYREEAVTSAMAVLGGAIGITSIVLPLLGGMLATINWRLVFLLPMLALPIALFAFIKLPGEAVSPFDFSLRLYAIELWGRVRNLQFFGLLLSILCVFVLQFGPCYIYIPIFASMQEANAEVIGVLLASTQVFLVLFAAQIVALSRRWSESALIKAAFVLYAISFLSIPSITNVWLLFVPCFFIGAGEALSLSPTRAMIARLAPNQTRAGFMSITVLAQSLGQALGPILSGAVFDSWGIQAVFFAGAGFALLIVGLFHVLLPTKVS